MGMPSEIAAALEARGVRWREVQALAGDVSRRRYFRLVDAGDPSGSRVLAVYPEDLREACRRFGVTAGWLEGVGVRGPAVVEADCAAGWMLVEDLGPETLYDRFRAVPEPWDRLRPWVRTAAQVAARIATLPREPVAALNPPLDGALLRRELDTTWKVFFEPSGLTRRDGLGRRLDQALTGLCGELESAPLVPCHRDFMVRNLVPVGDSLGVLDHQDLRLGPQFYDLASLLNDSLFAPEDLEVAILGEAGLDDRLAYRRAAVQRTLKAVGTFAGSGSHGDLIRPTLERTLGHLVALPEGDGIAEALAGWARPVLDDLLD